AVIAWRGRAVVAAALLRGTVLLCPGTSAGGSGVARRATRTGRAGLAVIRGRGRRGVGGRVVVGAGDRDLALPGDIVANVVQHVVGSDSQRWNNRGILVVE